MNAVASARLQGNLKDALERLFVLSADAISSAQSSSLEGAAQALLGAAQDEIPLSNLRQLSEARQKQWHESQAQRLHVAQVADALGNVTKTWRARCELQGKSDGDPKTGTTDGNAQKCEEIGSEEREEDKTGENKSSKMEQQVMAVDIFKTLEAAYKLRKKCLEVDPENEDLKRLVARSQSSLAMWYHSQGKLELADKAHMEALELFSKVSLRTPGVRSNGAPEADANTKAFNFNASPDPGSGTCFNTASLEVQASSQPPSSAAKLAAAPPPPPPVASAPTVSGLPLPNVTAAKQSGLDAPSSQIDVEPELQQWEAYVQSRLELVSLKLDTSIQKATRDAKAAHHLKQNTAGSNKSRDPLVALSDRRGGLSSPMSAQSNVFDSQSFDHFCCRLVLLKDPSSSLSAEMDEVHPFDVQQDNTHIQDAVELDTIAEHIPRQVVLNPMDCDVVQFGRQAYKDAFEFFKARIGSNAEKPTVRKIGFVRLDSEITDLQISRRHAQIKYSRIHPLVPREGGSSYPGREDDTDGQASWVIRDLESTNGILVNGVRVQEHPLRHGDIVSFGGAHHIKFGSAVVTHSRPPINLVFLYRFEDPAAEEQKSREQFGLGWDPNFETIRSSLDRHVQAFCYQRPDSRPHELLHFYLLFASVFELLFPERAAKLGTPAALEHQISLAKQLHDTAVNECIPFTHWHNWIRSELPKLFDK